MGSCFAFTDEVSAVNQSWICENSLFNHNDTDEMDACMFLYEQQFNRPHWYCGYVEAVVIITISIFAFPANFFALYNFKRREVSNEFLLLVSALAMCNLTYAGIGIIKGIGRVVDDWPMGTVGCTFSITGGSVSLTMSWWAFALISIERRNCVVNNMASGTISRNQRGCSKRFWQLAITLALLFVICIGIHFLHLHSKNALQVIPVYIAGVKNGTEPVSVCLADKARLGINSETFFFLFSFMTLWIPLGTTIVNYCWLWRYVQKAHVARSPKKSRRRHLSASDDVYEQRRLIRNQRKRELLLARLMVASVVQFLFSVVPVILAMAQASYQRKIGKQTAQSFGMFVALTIQVLDSTLNPFWSSLVRYKQTVKRRQSFTDSICPNNLLDKKLDLKDITDSSLPDIKPTASA